MDELEAKIIRLLQRADLCQNITKYVQEQELRRTLMPQTKTNELWFSARVPATVSDEDRELDKVSDEVLLQALLGNKKNTHHSLYFHFNDTKKGEGKYSPDDSGVLTLTKDKKVPWFSQCKLSVEYKNIPILETEDVDLATRIYYHVVNSELRYNQRESDIKRKEFLGLNF